MCSYLTTKIRCVISFGALTASVTSIPFAKPFPVRPYGQFVRTCKKTKKFFELLEKTQVAPLVASEGGYG